MYWSQSHHSCIFLAALGLQWPRIQTGAPQLTKLETVPIWLSAPSMKTQVPGVGWAWSLGSAVTPGKPQAMPSTPHLQGELLEGRAVDPTPRQSTAPALLAPSGQSLSPAGTRALGGPQASCPLPRLGPPPQTRAQRTRRPHPQVRGDQVGSGGIGGGWLFHREPGPGPHGPPLGQLWSWTGQCLSECLPQSV